MVDVRIASTCAGHLLSVPSQLTLMLIREVSPASRVLRRIDGVPERRLQLSSRTPSGPAGTGESGHFRTHALQKYAVLALFRVFAKLV